MVWTDEVYYELPLPCVLDATDIDPLLQKLRAVHGEPRFDIAQELIAAMRRGALAAGVEQHLKDKQNPPVGGGLVPGWGK